MYRSQLAGLDKPLSVGEKFFVGHLLDHAKLTRRDKAMVKTYAGAETETSITGAMLELAGELEGEAGYPIGQAEGQLTDTGRRTTSSTRLRGHEVQPEGQAGAGG